MPFALDGQPSLSEITEAINYLLGNLTVNVTTDPNTGQIIGPGGDVVGYLYKYLMVKYSDSFDGTLNFSNTPTNKAYYGLRNSNSDIESTNPADYIWYEVTGGFGTTKSLWYLTTGGRQIQLSVSSVQPNPGWEQDTGPAIDLDVINAVVGSPANFVVIRVPNNSGVPTDAECIAAIGRTPIYGDLCTINYNSGIYSIEYRYTTGWAIFQKYITGDLIVANTITASNIKAGTITATEIAANTITGSNIAANTITGTNIAGNTVTASNMVTGTITAASAILATASVQTLTIQNNAVTIPVYNSAAGSGASAAITTDGTTPIQIIAFFTNARIDNSTFTLRKNGSNIVSYSISGATVAIYGSYTLTYQDTPSSGTNTYTVAYSNGSGASVANTALTLLAVKR